MLLQASIYLNIAVTLLSTVYLVIYPLAALRSDFYGLNISTAMQCLLMLLWLLLLMFLPLLLLILYHSFSLLPS